MKAGKLDRLVTVLRSTVSIDDTGTPSPTWAPLTTLRAQIIQQSADEFIKDGGGAQSANAIVFRTRYFDGIRLDDRIEYEGAHFDIVETKEIGRRRGLEIRCIARVS